MAITRRYPNVGTNGSTVGASTNGRQYVTDQWRDGSSSEANKLTEVTLEQPQSDGTFRGSPNTYYDYPAGEGPASNPMNQSYQNAFELMKNYPEWVAMLNANPYQGFDIPESLFDKLGLSNKAKDKMNALKQEYLNYNAQILANFLNWKNSLPQTQREQLNEAGYASDLANVQPSNVPTEIPQGSNALAMPSGSTGEELMQVIGTAASLFSSGASIALGVMQTVANIGLIDKQKENLGKVGEGLELSNFESSLTAAKRIYSNLAPSLKKPKDPDEIMTAVSLQYPDAPESVNKALKNYVNSREFQEGLFEAETGLQSQESAFHQSFMTNEDLKMLVGSPDYWLGIRKIANETYLKQVEKIQDYLDTLDVVTQVRSSNAYYDYINQYYTELASLGVPSLSAQTAVMQNRAALSTYDMQRSLAERNKSMLEIKNQEMQEYFDKLTSDDTSAWSKWWAAFQLTNSSFLSRWTDPNASGASSPQPFSPVGFSTHSMPSFSLLPSNRPFQWPMHLPTASAKPLAVLSYI